MKTVLITGGAGFIGSHMCDFLLEKDFFVICMDNLITGKKSNIEHLMDNPHFEYITHDITNEIKLEQELDFIMHLASPASPIDYQKIPIPTLKAGSLGTHNLLGLSRVKKAVFFLASTSEVYGDPEVNPQPETYYGNVNPVGPRSCYDEAKRFAEAITVAYHHIHKVDVRIARIFNTYGPRMRPDDGRVVPAFINQALNNEPLTVFGDGSQTRSFCYVSDLIKGIYKLMTSNVTEPVNLGNPDEMTIMQFSKKILSITGSTSTIIQKPLPENDPKTRQPDITKAKQLLQWQPEVSLDVGLSKTIDFFKSKTI